ncbi:MAG: pyruvate kinase [Sulfolobales archaeon]
MKTKIIASLGPSTVDPKIIKEMLLIGVDCVRINFSHGEPGDWVRYIDMVRSSEKEIGEDGVCILGDLRGPSIRLGDLGETLKVARGSKVVFAKDPSKGVPIDSEEFFRIVDEGDLLLMDDGKMRFEVVSAETDYVETLALTDGALSSRKNVHIKGKDLTSPILSQRDYEALRIAVEKNLTFIGVSHVRNSEDIEIVKRNIRLLGGSQKVLAKIENRSAVDKLEEIINVSDGVVIARGDLGMSIGLEEIPRVQEEIIRKTREMGKPVILATQLLESMIKSPIPTRSEVQDIYTGVSMKVDALMLTGETAIGQYPLDTLRWLKRIISAAERYNVYEDERENDYRHISVEKSYGINTLDKFFSGVVKLAEAINANIVLFSKSGLSAYILSKYRPRTKIVCGTNNLDVYRSLKLIWGIKPVYVDTDNYDEGVEKTLEKSLEKKYIERGGLVIKTYARPQEDRYLVSIKRVI